MGKELVEMGVRIYSENVTFSAFLLQQPPPFYLIIMSPVEPGSRSQNRFPTAANRFLTADLASWLRTLRPDCGPAGI